ncbi:uncharacterized protein LOC120846494, partial [Ixodes scapularis]|uniref:uncharacterized protein LOC120846494 n=1 Tax=Ixodes scapularis TaxID=6945 RepID=UPI001A9D71F0
TAYKALIRSMLEYATVVWDPYTKVDSSKIERIENQSLRFVYSRYKRRDSITEMLSLSNTEPLRARRKLAWLNFLYCIANRQTGIDPTTYLVPPFKHSSRINNSHHIRPFRPSSNVLKFSFFSRTIDEWNLLPDGIVAYTTVEQFVDACFSPF